MIPDYEPTIPEWFHQQFVRDNFLAETQARLDAEEKEDIKRRYFVGITTLWLAAALISLFSIARLSLAHKKAPAASQPSQTFVPTPSTASALDAAYVEPQDIMPPLMAESDEMKEVLKQLGTVEVQGSLYTARGEGYRGPLWVRQVTRDKNTYLENSAIYYIDGPFRLRLPSDSTVYIYAPISGLDWNGGWGIPVQVPPSVRCSQPCGCALRLEDLMFASARK